MAVKTTTDGRMVASIRKAKSAPRGRDRGGIQASDLLAAMTDPVQAAIQNARVEKPRVMIETLRFVRSDNLTAKDMALYEGLFAQARLQGIEKECHRIAIADIAKFVAIKNPERLVESLERISDVRVRYDFVEDGMRRKSTQQLILIEVREQLATGATYLSYSIPEAVRKVVLASRDYAMLEINAFAKFRCRYTSRLYPRLALRAGMHAAVRKPWIIEPKKLAEELGYPMKNFSYGVFKRDVLTPAMADMAYPNVTRFAVSMEAPRGTGRGRSVDRITFHVTDAIRRIDEHKAATLSRRGMAAVRATDQALEPDELPSTLVVARAVTATGLDERVLSEGWRSAYERAKADPAREVLLGLEGWSLINLVKQNGVGSGFSLWAELAAKAPVIPTTRPMSPSASSSPRSSDAPLGVKPAKTPEDSEAKNRRIAERFADDILNQLDGYMIGREIKGHFDANHFVRWCDPEVPPWSCAAGRMKHYGLLERALEILQRTDDNHRRRSLFNLATAVKAWNFFRLTQIAGAIVKDAESRNGAGASAVAVRAYFPAGCTPTLQVTEASAEYDFADPVYVSNAISWDDRADFDMARPD